MEKKFFGYHLNINDLETIPTWIKLANNYPKIQVIIAVTETIAQALGGLANVKANFDYYQKKMDCNNVWLHLDHGKTITICQEAIELGFNSVMYDGSDLEINKHLIQAKKIAKIAKKAGVFLELELGKMNYSRPSSHFTKLTDIILISESVQFDWLAIAIGNYHGFSVNNQKPKLNFDLLQKIQKTTEKRLVLHGASGISFSALKKAIKYGVWKINFDSVFQKSAYETIHKLYREPTKLPENFQTWLQKSHALCQISMYNQAKKILENIFE